MLRQSFGDVREKPVSALRDHQAHLAPVAVADAPLEQAGRFEPVTEPTGRGQAHPELLGQGGQIQLGPCGAPLGVPGSVSGTAVG